MVNDKESSIEFRELAIKYYSEGVCLGEIAKIRKGSKSTVKNFKKTGSVRYRKKTGWPRKLDKREERQVLKKIRQNPKFTGIKIAKSVSESYKKDVYSRTIQKIRVLNISGFRA
ncbi:uncharacterized protein LOC129614881 [Condylostylus longicornis]|uniref:uncharacterized protein LOC129614881 n=1 Tax=Condylostylus longicornis TaxID=2530218 RepID=UPI00244E3B1F|nr:uncharacterized protein LOC129614881 [Condylostylus longicornis]